MAWLAAVRRWFGGGATARAGKEPTGQDALQESQAAPGDAAESFDLLDARRRHFTAMLLGAGELHSDPAESAERRAMGRLADLLRDDARTDAVPRLPLVLPRLMRIIRRDDVSARQLVEQLSSDPTLIGEVVRLANSPLYRPARAIADLHDAVITLGQRGLMQIAVAAAMRPIFGVGHGRFSRIAGKGVWDLAQRCSAACADLCGHEDERFHGYLAGMVAHIGMIPALRVLDEHYQEPRAPDSEQFHDSLDRTVAVLSGRIARHWDFHPSVCAAVEQRADGGPPDAADDLACALRTADRISKLHLLAPRLPAAALARLSEPERRCYRELQAAFGRG